MGSTSGGIAFARAIPDEQSYLGSIASMTGPAYENSNVGCVMEFQYFSHGDTSNHQLIPAFYLPHDQRFIELDHILPTQEAVWKKGEIGIGRHKNKFEVSSILTTENFQKKLVVILRSLRWQQNNRSSHRVHLS